MNPFDTPPTRTRALKIPLTAVALALSLMSAPFMSAQAEEPPAVQAVDARMALVAEVARTAGWDEGFAQIERSLRDRALADKRIRRMQRPAYNTFGLYVKNSLAKSVLMTDAIARLKTATDGLTDEQLRRYIDAIKQPLPQRMLALDRTATMQTELPHINRYKVNLQTKAPPKERLALVDRYLAASGLRAAYMQDQIGQLRQLLVSAQEDLSEEDLASQLTTLRPELEKRVEFNARADVLALYRDVSDADLEAYAKLLESSAVSDVLTQVTRVRVEVEQNAMQGMLTKLAEAVPPTRQEISEVEAANKARRQ